MKLKVLKGGSVYMNSLKTSLVLYEGKEIEVKDEVGKVLLESGLAEIVKVKKEVKPKEEEEE